MASLYLLPQDYAAFGLKPTTTADQVQRASAFIDGYLKRAEGLVWLPDASGAPAYMAAPSPQMTLHSAGAIPTGNSIAVPYAGPAFDNNIIGEVVVLDRGNPGAVEACVISAVAPGQVTLSGVKFPHAAGATLDFGLVITEERQLPNERSVARVAATPVMRLLSGLGRYGYGRRSEQKAGDIEEFNLLATVSSFGGPPLWVPWDVGSASVSPFTGEIWVPAGVLLAYYSEVRIRYVGGWSQAGLPGAIKQACANITAVLQETGLGANIRARGSKDGIRTEKFENTLIDADTRQMLEPYRPRLWG